MSCGMWDLDPQSGVEPVPPALKVQDLNHWITREVQNTSIINKSLISSAAL